MNNIQANLTLEPAADTPRPLALTPGADLRGYLLAHLGRAVLFLLTFTSVFAVLLILLAAFGVPAGAIRFHQSVYGISPGECAGPAKGTLWGRCCRPRALTRFDGYLGGGGQAQAVDKRLV